MKTLLKLAICTIVILKVQIVAAQNLPEFTKGNVEKARIFDRLPSKFSIYNSAFEKVFAFKVNEKVVIPMGGSNFFEGTVTEKVQHNEQVLTINISSSNFPGALFTLSKINRPGKPVSYTGRLISIKHGDAFMMSIAGNEMVFTKQKQSLLVSE